jgi:antitoxin component of MazEF toxin-antitoxin module
MIGQTMTLDYNLASMTATKVVWQSNKMKTSYPLRVQAIRSHGQNPRLYVSFPLALAAAIGLEAGEEVEWELLNRGITSTPAQSTSSSRQDQASQVSCRRHHNHTILRKTAKSSLPQHNRTFAPANTVSYWRLWGQALP